MGAPAGRGAYHNDNFLLNSRRTTAVVEAHLDLDWGWSPYTYFYFTPSGEASFFLSGRATRQGGLLYTNRCPGGSGGGSTGGGSTGGGNTGGGSGGGTTCVDVNDGVTGDYLGTCCGRTTAEIVSCAAGYI